MPEMIYGQTNVGITVPAGRYVARFVGTEEREPFKESKFGNASTAARMAWVFEVVEGEKKGEKFAQESGTTASPRSTAARVITGLNGGPVAVGQKVDTAQFVGRVYVVKVAVNSQSDKGNLHVADIEPHGGTPPLQAGAGAGAPPPRKAPAPSTKVDTSDYYVGAPVCEAGQEKKVTAEDVRTLILQKGLKAADLELCRVGETAWKTAADFGFENAVF